MSQRTFCGIFSATDLQPEDIASSGPNYLEPAKKESNCGQRLNVCQIGENLRWPTSHSVGQSILPNPRWQDNIVKGNLKLL